jgi:hypothetical protein
VFRPVSDRCVNINYFNKAVISLGPHYFCLAQIVNTAEAEQTNNFQTMILQRVTSCEKQENFILATQP